MRRSTETDAPASNRASLALGLVAALPACLLLAPHISYVPFWDAGDYLFQLRSAASSEFNGRSYFFSDHPTFLFALLMSVPVKLFPARIEALNVTSIVLFVASVMAFRAAAARIRDGAEATLAAACYALCPALLGNVLFFTPDLGVAVFFPIYLAALLSSPGPGSALAGAFLASSKETGFALYAASVPLYPICFGWKALGWRKLAWLAAPAMATAAIYALFEGPPSRGDFLESTAISPLNIFRSAEAKAFLADTFVLSFSWIPAAVAALGIRHCRAPTRRTVFLTLFFAASVYATTRVATWNNPRYLIPSYTLLFLLAYTALPAILTGKSARKGALAAFAALLAVSDVRSIDPVSSAIFRPLELGERKMWNLQDGWASWDTPSWPVRDQLVYNLEYLNLHWLLNDMLRHVRPDAGSVFVVAPAVNHFKLKFVDPLTFERSIGKPGDLEVICEDDGKRPRWISGPGRARTVHLVAYPAVAAVVEARWIEKFGYLPKERRVFERNGYALPYVRYERDDILGAPLPAPDVLHPIPEPR